MKKINFFYLLCVFLNCLVCAMNETSFPLHEAVKSGDIERVAALIVNANVDKQDDKGLTPLHYAVKKLHFEIACLLLNSGACANARDKWDTTPLCRLVKVSCSLCKSRCDPEVLPFDEKRVEATRAMAELLLDKGALINDKFADRNTAFNWAIFRNQVGVVRLFIARGFDVNLKDIHGLSPLHRALLERNGTIAQLLIDAPGIDINAPTDDGRSPLMLAIDRRMPQIAQLLVSRGADVNYVDPQNKAVALHYALLPGSDVPSVLKMIVDSPLVDLHAGDDCSWGGPLAYTARRKLIDLEHFLRLAPARIGMRNARFEFLYCMMAKPEKFCLDSSRPLTCQILHRLPLHIIQETCSYLRPEVCAYDSNLLEVYDCMHRRQVEQRLHVRSKEQNARGCRGCLGCTIS